MTLLDTLKQGLCGSNPLLAHGDHVLVAVSGGTDSIALLHALHTLRGEIGLRGLSAAHFHHGLRGQEADDDAAFVAQFCGARSIPCFTEYADIAGQAARAHVSTQQAARTARYAFLAQTARAYGANKAATAHTQDDQIETVLLNILRGTGLNGLRGIPPRRGLYVRPLLGVTRAQTEAHCAAHSLAPRQDSSNADSSHYTRNRIRRELLPLLEEQYHSGARGSLLRLAHIAGEDADFLRAHAEAMLREATLAQTPSPAHLALSRERLRALHPALLPHVLRAALAQVRGSAEGVTSRHVTLAAEALRLPGTAHWGMTTPPPRCQIAVRDESVVFTMTDTFGRGDVPVIASAEAYLVPLVVDGTAALPGGAGWVRAALAATPPPASADRIEALWDAAHVHLPSLHVRGWRAGDRIATRGLAGHTQKLQDIFTNAKVPRAVRPFVPLVADRDGLLWAAGLAASERGRAGPETGQFLVLTASSSANGAFQTMMQEKGPHKANTLP